MAPKSMTELKPGMTFSKDGYKLEITWVTPHIINFTLNGNAYKDHRGVSEPKLFWDALTSESWEYNEKPLDRAFRELDLSLGGAKQRPLCSHKNILYDKWFTNKVFASCKDCGAAIN